MSEGVTERDTERRKERESGGSSGQPHGQFSLGIMRVFSAALNLQTAHWEPTAGASWSTQQPRSDTLALRLIKFYTQCGAPPLHVALTASLPGSCSPRGHAEERKRGNANEDEQNFQEEKNPAHFLQTQVVFCNSMIHDDMLLDKAYIKQGKSKENGQNMFIIYLSKAFLQ